MATVQLQAWLMIAVAIFCGVRTFRDFASGNVIWAIISLVATLAVLICITVPIPTHAVKIDLPG